MAELSAAPGEIDPRSGFCTATRTFHSVRTAGAFPPESLPVTAAAYAFSLLSSPLPDRPALVDAATGIAVSYPSFLAAVRSLAGGLWSTLGLRPGDVALVVAPSRLDVPVLHFALMSIGAVVSPANPASTAEEYAHQAGLSRPVVAFAAPEVAANPPYGSSPIPVVPGAASLSLSLSLSEPPKWTAFPCSPRSCLELWWLNKRHDERDLEALRQDRHRAGAKEVFVHRRA